MKRRLLTRGAAVAAAAAALAIGAGGATAGTTTNRVARAAAAPVTLNMQFVNTVENAWVPTIAAFEAKYPNIHVNATYLESTDLQTQLATEFQAGDAPDVFSVSPGYGTTGIWTLAAAGKLLNLTGSPWVSAIPSSGIAGFTVDKKVYGWPEALGVNGVLYNTALFKQLKLSVPTKLSQFYTLCRTLKADGKIPVALGIAGSLVGVEVMELQLEAQFVFGRDVNWVVQRNANKVQFTNSPYWKNLFQVVENMENAGCFESNAAGTTYPTGAADLVASGQAAMEFLSGGTVASVTSVDPSLQYRMFELPASNVGDNKQTVASTNYSLSIGASAATQYPAQVKTFLDYVAGAKVDHDWAVLAGSIAPRDAKVGTFPYYLSTSDSPLAGAGRLLVNPNYEIQNPAWTTDFTNDLVGLFTGQQTITSSLANLDASWALPAT